MNKNIIKKNIPFFLVFAVISSTAIYGMEDDKTSWGEWLASYPWPSSGSSSSQSAPQGRNLENKRPSLPSALRSRRLANLQKEMQQLQNYYDEKKASLSSDDDRSNIERLLQETNTKMSNINLKDITLLETEMSKLGDTIRAIIESKK